MNLNLDMSKKLNFNPAQEPEEKIPAEKARIKAAFEKNIDLDGYCWTHGFQVTNRHSIQTRLAPSAVNQRAPIQKKYHGGQQLREIIPWDGDGIH